MHFAAKIVVPELIQNPAWLLFEQYRLRTQPARMRREAGVKI